MITGIYAVVHIATGRWYIGKAVDIARRWSDHKSDALKGKGKYFQSAIRKYGADAFEHFILEETTKELLSDREIYWLSRVKQQVEVFNLTSGGGSLGRKLSEEAKARISAANKGRQSSLGRKQTEEAKQRIRLANLGNKNHAGKPHTEASKLKMSLAKLGNNHGAR